MLRVIEGLPDNVVGIVAKGRVTADECDRILMPVIHTSLQRDGARLYYEIGSRIPAARWDDLQIGVDCIPRWERVAVVTDIGWIRQTVKALRFLIGGDIRVFTTSEAGDGLAWIRSPQPPDSSARSRSRTAGLTKRLSAKQHPCRPGMQFSLGA